MSCLQAFDGFLGYPTCSGHMGVTTDPTPAIEFETQVLDCHLPLSPTKEKINSLKSAVLSPVSSEEEGGRLI